ncbi:hypothetical protein TNCV_4742681 [Trichonephila clavipes]|nr:hypothetical protein TNCV_4742681 [Trichonephila clavipes]
MSSFHTLLYPSGQFCHSPIGSTASLSEHVQLHFAEKCQIKIKFLVKLKKSAPKVFQISTNAYADFTFYRAHVFKCHYWISGKGSVRKMMNMLGTQVKSCIKGTHFTSVEELQSKTEYLLNGLPKNLVPELLPAMTSPNAEVRECCRKLL